MQYLKFLCAFLLFTLMFYAGVNRKSYDNFLAKQFGSYTGYHYSKEKFPTDIDKLSGSLVSNHKWLGATSLSLFFIVLSFLMILILFNAHSALQILWIYIYALVAMGLLIMLGFITDNYFISYGLAQNVKKLIQSPLLTLFFILYFWKIKPAKETTS